MSDVDFKSLSSEQLEEIIKTKGISDQDAMDLRQAHSIDQEEQAIENEKQTFVETGSDFGNWLSDVGISAASSSTLEFGDEVIGGVLAGWKKATGDKRSLSDIYKDERDDIRKVVLGARSRSPVGTFIADVLAPNPLKMINMIGKAAKLEKAAKFGDVLGDFNKSNLFVKLAPSVTEATITGFGAGEDMSDSPIVGAASGIIAGGLGTLGHVAGKVFKSNPTEREMRFLGFKLKDAGTRSQKGSPYIESIKQGVDELNQLGAFEKGSFWDADQGRFISTVSEGVGEKVDRKVVESGLDARDPKVEALRRVFTPKESKLGIEAKFQETINAADSKIESVLEKFEPSYKRTIKVDNDFEDYKAMLKAGIIESGEDFKPTTNINIDDSLGYVFDDYIDNTILSNHVRNGGSALTWGNQGGIMSKIESIISDEQSAAKFPIEVVEKNKKKLIEHFEKNLFKNSSSHLKTMGNIDPNSVLKKTFDRSPGGLGAETTVPRRVFTLKDLHKEKKRLHSELAQVYGKLQNASNTDLFEKRVKMRVASLYRELIDENIDMVSADFSISNGILPYYSAGRDSTLMKSNNRIMQIIFDHQRNLSDQIEHRLIDSPFGVGDIPSPYALQTKAHAAVAAGRKLPEPPLRLWRSALQRAADAGMPEGKAGEVVRSAGDVLSTASRRVAPRAVSRMTGEESGEIRKDRARDAELRRKLMNRSK